MSQEQLWVIAYDSPSNKRRRKLAKLLEGYGVRLQWSVFECRLQPHQLRRLRQGLDRIAEPAESIRLWSLPAWAAEQTYRHCAGGVREGARKTQQVRTAARSELWPFRSDAHPPAIRRNPSVFVILRAAMRRRGSQRFPQG
ncbi:CRISPR-associated endonuclease Cas2 [Aphanothece minutissima]|nr:CRISPR-associated endonuclease Cas2 [Aphanothece minutissima]